MIYDRSGCGEAQDSRTREIHPCVVPTPRCQLALQCPAIAFSSYTQGRSRSLVRAPVPRAGARTEASLCELVLNLPESSRFKRIPNCYRVRADAAARSRARTHGPGSGRSIDGTDQNTGSCVSNLTSSAPNLSYRSWAITPEHAKPRFWTRMRVPMAREIQELRLEPTMILSHPERAQ